MNIDFKNMETYHYFIAGGAGLVVISILLYFLKGSKLRVSAFAATIIGSLALGFGAGIVTLAALGYNWNEKHKDEPQGGAPPGGMGGGMGGPKKDAPKKAGPNAKLQLAALVVKLNLLTEKEKPLAINLGDRKAKVAEQLKDLDTVESLSDDDAKKRVDALMDLLKPDEAMLAAAGFNLEAAGNVKGMAKDAPANPFTTDANKAALKALQERVAK